MPSQIGFSTRTGIVPSIIRWVTRSKVSHVWFTYNDQDFKCRMVMEAGFHGFTLVPYENFVKHNNIIKVVNPKYDIDEGLASVSKWLGSLYDVRGLLGMAFVMLGRFLRLKWKNPFRNTKFLFCSESIARAMLACNYPGSSGMDPEAVTPQDLLKFFEVEETIK